MMNRAGIGFAAGLLFGVGLLVSRMADPAKVLNFLNLMSHWDASLIFVMVGGVGVMMAGYWMGRRRTVPLLGGGFPDLPRHGVNTRLVGGAVVFGLGWGLMGLCPGPALVDLTLAPLRMGVFTVMMFVGLWGTRAIGARTVTETARIGVKPI